MALTALHADDNGPVDIDALSELRLGQAVLIPEPLEDSPIDPPSHWDESMHHLSRAVKCQMVRRGPSLDKVSKCVRVCRMDLRERVIHERKLRFPSQRQASAAGRISNTTWGRFETSGEVTPAIRKAVARAFEWPKDWPENPPPLPLLADSPEIFAKIKHLEDWAVKAVGEVNVKLDRLISQLGVDLAHTPTVERLAASREELRTVSRQQAPRGEPAPKPRSRRSP